MGSRATLEFEAPITEPMWASYCESNNVTFSPTTMGGDTYYHNAKVVQGHVIGQVQLEVTRKEDCIVSVRVGSFFMKNLEESASVLESIGEAFCNEVPLVVSGDDEVLESIGLNIHIQLKYRKEEGDDNGE